jgi:hypothetical protein
LPPLKRSTPKMPENCSQMRSNSKQHLNPMLRSSLMLRSSSMNHRIPQALKRQRSRLRNKILRSLSLIS